MSSPDMDALRSSDPRHYDDRRSHLIALGATDTDIQTLVQAAVDNGLRPIEYLAKVEQMMRRNSDCTLLQAARGALVESVGWLGL